MKHKTLYNKYDDDQSVVMSIVPANKGKLRRRKLLMILLYGAYIAMWGIALGVLQTYVAYIAALFMVSFCALIYFTWRYTAPEYELCLHKGCLTVAVIYGGLTRRDLFSCRVRELRAVGPYETGEGHAAVAACGPAHRLETVSGQAGREVYYAIHRSETGVQTILIFDTAEKLRKLLRYYRADVTSE